MPQAAQTRRAVGQTRAGRGGGTHRRDLRRPKGPDVSVLASSSSTCMINSPPLHGDVQFRLHRIALALLERGVDPADFSRHCSSRKISTPIVAPARHAKAHERPHGAPPSIAGQVPAGLPAKPGLGKTWTKPSSPATTGPYFFSKLSVTGPPTLIKPILVVLTGAD